MRQPPSLSIVSMAISIHPEWDIELIRAFALHPDIWPRIADSNVNPDDWAPTFENSVYLFVKADRYIGYWWLQTKNSITVQIHPVILPKYRKYSAESYRAIEKMIPCKKVMCEIPACYKDVVWFASRMGFEREGVLKGAIDRDGIQDLIMMGKTL